MREELIEELPFPAVISEVIKSEEEPQHKILYFNTEFYKKFPFISDSTGLFLEELFGPVFAEPGLSYFSYENQNFYVFNVPADTNKKLHFFVEESEWLRFPHWFHRDRLASLGKLAGEISHELNNPLSGILLYANLLKEELPQDSPHHLWVDRIIALTQRCKTIARGLLDFGKPEKGKCEWIDLNWLLKKVYELVKGYPLFRHINFSWKLYENLPAFYGNRVQIEQVILNIFTNAAEAMKGKGEIFIKTGIKNDHIVIKITDTGPGIPKEVMPYIFDPFFTTKEKNKGTGLGLSICHGIVKKHKGFMRVYNTKQAGACFEVHFPLYTREALREDDL